MSKKKPKPPATQQSLPEQMTFVFEEILDRVSGPFEKEVGRERPKR